MKKLLFLLLMLLPLGFLGSCSDDNDVPNVELTVTMDGLAKVDGNLYAVQGTPFSVKSISVNPINGSKAATVSMVAYSVDYQPVGISAAEPFGISFDTSFFPAGRHLIQMSFSILQVDKSIFSSLLSYMVTVVESPEDLPDGAELGEVVSQFTVSPK